MGLTKLSKRLRCRAGLRMCEFAQRLSIAWNAFLHASWLHSPTNLHHIHALRGMKFESKVAVGILSLNNFAIKDKVYAGYATSLKVDNLSLGEIDCELALLIKA